MPLTLAQVEGEPILGWHVRDGQLWVELGDRGVVVACDCGHPHLLPTETAERHLLVTCHACGRHSEVPLAAEAFSRPRA